ncbi:MAG: hypothetical protein LCH91_15595 [Bacteroidetes bacterium]|nr:hypothetical protein [Bacteroidota bacterium]
MEKNDNNSSSWILWGILLLVLLSRNNSAASPIKVEKYKFVAKRDGVPVFVAVFKNDQWTPDFNKASLTFKMGQTISTVWLGEITLISNEGVKTPFYILEVTLPPVPYTGFLGLTVPVAVKMDDINRYVV